MKLNEPSISSNSVQWLPLAPDCATQPLNGSDTKPSRLSHDLSWQVASNLLVSFKFAWAGLTYAFETQRNFRIHTVIATLVIGLAILLQLEPVEIAVLAITVGIVLAMELLNTAIESVVNLTVQQTYHDLARIAKDCAAGAVLVSALAAVAVGCTLLLPPLVALARSVFSF